jgi:uncharacterized protein
MGDDEYQILSEILSRFRSPRAMNLETVDGFFAALICGPEFVPPGEYLSQIWGGEMEDEEAFASEEEMQRFFDLLMRHWNGVVKALSSGDVFTPVLMEDEHGVAHANDWAQGFVRGMGLRYEDWVELLDDEDHGGWLVPILALANEHHPDPEMRPWGDPVDPPKREELIISLAAGVMAIYRYFAPHRGFPAQADRERTTYRRSAPKIGRNDPCPCGSGRKFKQCCGKVTLH